MAKKNNNKSKISISETIVESENKLIISEAKKTIVLVVDKSFSDDIVLSAIDCFKKFYGDFEFVTVGGSVAGYKNISYKESADLDINLANIIQAVILSDIVSEDFVFSFANAFPINLIQDSDIKSLYCLAKKLQTQDLICLKNTPELVVTKQLQKEGFDTIYNFETGLPVEMNKEKLIELFEKFNPGKYPTKIVSLYLNYFFKGHIPFPVDFRNGNIATKVFRSNPDMDVVSRAFKNSKFIIINNEGFSAIQKLLIKKIS